MARDGNGSHSLPESAFVFDTIIDETKVNNNFSDISAEITNSVDKDGQTVWTGNMDAGSKKITSMAVGSARTDSIRLDQVQDGSVLWGGTGGGTADVITVTLAPAITAHKTGLVIYWLSSGANTTNVTLNPNGIGAKAVTKNGATALVQGDIPNAAIVGARYDGTQYQLIGSLSNFTAADETKLDNIETAADVTDGTNVAAAGATMDADFDANTILAANSDNTPAALTIEEQRILGRLTSGNIIGLTAAQIRTFVDIAAGTTTIEDGATANTIEEFESAEQTIAVGTSSFTLAHSLSGQPQICQIWLRCKTGDLTYSIGDEVLYGAFDYGTSGRGFSVIPNATNVVIRQGSATTTQILKKDDGVLTNIVLGSWKMFVKAFYLVP